MNDNDRPHGTRHGPFGDAQPEKDDPDPRTGGSLDQEPPEDRDNVSNVKPEDYPQDRPR